MFSVTFFPKVYCFLVLGASCFFKVLLYPAVDRLTPASLLCYDNRRAH